MPKKEYIYGEKEKEEKRKYYLENKDKILPKQRKYYHEVVKKAVGYRAKRNKKYKGYMREYMRKRLNIKKENYRGEREIKKEYEQINLKTKDTS